MTDAPALAGPLPRRAGSSALGAALRRQAPLAAIVGVAAGLRLDDLGHVAVNPFYDASVRSMGTSWHAFLTGAIDPSASIAIDKPPVDLWLQVASTRLLGFTPLALHLPEALGGILAVLALYDLLRVLFGRAAGLAGALALALLPLAVITSRSDTMDSVMAALVIASAALVARAARADRPWLLVAAGAVLGLAFEVKLFEGLVAAPALVALWWLGAGIARRRRAVALGGAAGAFAVVAVAWLVALTLLGGPHRPFAFGSTNGSAWNATFVYDGLDRVTGGTARAHGVAGASPRSPVAARRRAMALARRPAPPGPARLFAGQAHLGSRIGVPLAAAALAFAVALLTGVPRGLDRPARAGWWALGIWLATGALLFSLQRGLKPRYLEALDPAVAAVIGAGVVLAARRLADTRPAWRWPGSRAAVALALAILLVLPAASSVAAARRRTQDAGSPGALPRARLDRLSAYLLAHQRGARYETASVSVGKAASLIARDGRPVLILTAAHARPVVGVRRLAQRVASGQVRSALVGATCGRRSSDPATGCSPTARWIRAHGVDVSRAAGQPHPGLVYTFSG